MANKYSSNLTVEREIAVRLLTRGYCTVAEIAHHYGKPRQTVAVWASGIDVATARDRFVKAMIARVSRRK